MGKDAPSGSVADKRAKHGLRLLGVVAVLLGGLYAGLRLQHEHSKPPLDRTVTFGLVVNAPQAGAPTPTFSVHQGDKVVILVSSQVPGEFHLHGYDRELPLKPGTSATLAFDAKLAGQFPIELHQGGGKERQIARLVVEPE
jgi:hypothetical protein